MLYDVKFALMFTNGQTREAILNEVSETEIFEHYLGHTFEEGKCFHSPFRSDPTPSFNIYADKVQGKLFYKDFGDANIVGDVFSFVARIENIPYNEVYAKIRKDILVKKQVSKARPFSKHERLLKPVTKKITYVPKRKMSDLERSYWDDIDVFEELREDQKIYCAKEVYVDDTLVWTSTPDNPIFVYKTFNKIKAYRPLEKNKRFKWLGNYSRYDIQGWEQLPMIHDEDTLIITKSKKDVAVLRTYGYLAIAPPAEGVMIPPAAMQLLTELYGFKKFIVLYDRDHGGMIAARKMYIKYRGEYNITFKFIPKNLAKDIDEVRRLLKRERTKTFLKNFLNYEPNEKYTILPTNGNSPVR
jgi:hypothetical protein